MDNELLRFARLAIATARRVVPPRLSRHADPTYHPASLLAALLLREHLRLTYRAVEDLLRLSDRLRRTFAFRIVPDHSTLWWFGRRHLGPDLIALALAETVARAAGDRHRPPGRAAAAEPARRSDPPSSQPPGGPAPAGAPVPDVPRR